MLTAGNRVLLLDGPTGTRLEAKGFAVDRPGWSARAILEAPELLEEIHRDYLAAGSVLLTANTFRTHEQNVRGWGKPGQAAELTHRAVAIARKAAGDRAWVLGSVAPVGDCYDPDQVPETDLLREAHQQMARNLQSAGVDAVLLETHVSLAEIRIAAEAARSCKLPLLISVYTPDGQQLLDGTPLAMLRPALQDLEPLAIGVNCLPVERVQTSLEILREFSLPLIVYANSGEMDQAGVWQETQGADPELHARLSTDWVASGVRILGGCCGTSPELIAKFSRLWQSERGKPPGPG